MSVSRDITIYSILRTYAEQNEKGPVYPWLTLTGVKLNNNWTQYSSPAIFWQCNKGTEPEMNKS